MKDILINIVDEHGWITMFIANVVITVLVKFDLITTILGKTFCVFGVLINAIIFIIAFIRMIRAFGFKFRKD